MANMLTSELEFMCKASSCCTIMHLLKLLPATRRTPWGYLTSSIHRQRVQVLALLLDVLRTRGTRARGDGSSKSHRDYVEDLTNRRRAAGGNRVDTKQTRQVRARVSEGAER